MVQINPKVTWIAIIAIAILSSDCRSLKIDDYGYMNTMKETGMVAPSSKFFKFYKDFSGLTWILCHLFDHDSGTTFILYMNLAKIRFNPSINDVFYI